MARRLSILSTLALTLGLAIGPTLAVPSLAHAGVPEIGKIALVDMQQVLNKTNEGKKARKELETSSSKKQKKLDKKRQKLEADQAKLQKMPQEQAMAAAEKLQREAMELQSMYMTLQQELAEQEARMLEKIYSKTQTIVKGMAKSDGLDLVLIRDDTTVLYSKTGFDITDAVIKKYNAK